MYFFHLFSDIFRRCGTFIVTVRYTSECAGVCVCESDKVFKSYVNQHIFDIMSLSRLLAVSCVFVKLHDYCLISHVCNFSSLLCVQETAGPFFCLSSVSPFNLYVFCSIFRSVCIIVEKTCSVKDANSGSLLEPNHPLHKVPLVK